MPCSPSRCCCRPRRSPPARPAAATEEVVASFYPLQYVAERIVGDHAKVTNLTAPGVEPHDLELSPRQAARVSGASVVFYEKGLQPAVDEAVRNDGPEHVVDAAKAVTLRDAEEDGEGGGVDPHFWLDPTLLAQAADAFTEQMSEADPDHAADFEAGNAKLQADLAALDGDFKAGLKDCTTRTVVVSHDAFEYLGARYDLDMHPIAGPLPRRRAVGPTPRRARRPDPHRQDHHRVQRATGQPQAGRHPGLRPRHHAPRCSTRSRGWPRRRATTTTSSLMRENLEALRKAGGCS